MLKANVVFSAAQLADMEKLIAINSELKALETKKKNLNDKVKKHLSSLNVDECELNGNEFKLTNSLRRTVTKATKNEFVAALAQKGKGYLLTTSIEPDIDSIFAEVDAGTLDKNFVDTYIKTTSVQTLRTN